MKELTEEMKLGILKLFLLGYSYDDIATNCDVSKGTVANVVSDFRAGRFPAFTDISELVDALRELSVELKKKGAGVSEALLGIAFFSRLDGIGVTPDKLWLWAEMCREMAPAGVPLEEFTAAALELFRLSHETGESYKSVSAKWSQLRAESESLRQEVEELRSKKEELETTQAALIQECQRLREEKQDLEQDSRQLSTRSEALRNDVAKLEASKDSLNGEVAELSEKVRALRPEVEALEGLGFSKKELETLKVKLSEVALSRGLTPEALSTRFFHDIAEYGAMLGLEEKRQLLEGEVAGLQAQKESLEHFTSRLGLPWEEVEEAVKCLISLKKRGVTPSTVLSYHRVLSQANIESGELEKEILELGGLKKAIASRMEEVKKLEGEERKHTRVVEGLQAEETEIKAAIHELKESGVKEVKEASLAATEEVRRVDRTFLEDIRQWGDIKAEIGKYEGELKLARYFGRLPMSEEAVAAMVEELPALVVVQYLTISLAWCSKKFNPKLRPPRSIVGKYYQIAEYTSVELADLLAWSLITLTEGGAYGSK